MSNFIASFKWPFGKYQLSEFRMSVSVDPFYYAISKLHVLTSKKKL